MTIIKLNRKFVFAVGLIVSIPAVWYGIKYFETGVIKLDQEHKDKGVALNPSTQSINRYFSTLRNLNKVIPEIDEHKKQLSLVVTDEKNKSQVVAAGLNIEYLVPLLPYPHSKRADDFDLTNLMLAEYARNGISLSYQEKNRKFGVFNASANMFNSKEEYIYKAGQIMPNSDVKPVRLNITNNCLKPGLWEISASDTVGEMYHGWFKFPKATYYKMIRSVNNIDVSNWDLGWALKYKKDIRNVEVKLDRLREAGTIVLETRATINKKKMLGSYSSQDSRRKAQKGYFSVVRQGEKIFPANLSELKKGDRFEMHKFVSPGVYSPSDIQTVHYDSDWKNITIRKVKPLTRYPGGTTKAEDTGYLELTFAKDNAQEAIVVGNIPISLLVFQDDYRIPAFGAGVLSSSELIERRYLRITKGPFPHYAYQIRKNNNNNWALVNNHETGLEQIFLRPFEKDNEVYLRVTLVSYERIVDLFEMEIKLNSTLAASIRIASKKYNPPVYKVYSDSNVL